MRLSRLGLVLVLLSSAKGALAQVPSAPAAEPAPSGNAQLRAQTEPPPAPPAPEVLPDEPATAPVPPANVDPPSVVEPTPAPVAEPAAESPAALPLDAAGTVAAPEKPRSAEPPPWPRVHSPLTLEARLGFLVRPTSSSGFDEESIVGAELGLSLYLELKRALAVGLEIERASLGRGTSTSGLDTTNVDYSVSSAMLGLRAYPKRTELFDVFVGLQIGLGFQGVSAVGTAGNGDLLPATSYRCDATDAPAFQLGGGIGARLMLSRRWGVTARVNGAARRLTGEMVESCARGIGTAATVSAGIGLGYDFDLDP